MKNKQIQINYYNHTKKCKDIRDNCLSGPKYCPECEKEIDRYKSICNFCGSNLNLFRNKKKQRKESKNKTKASNY
ncbi:MAG: hypothetical protein ACFFCY_03430 [Promethearchaeota archaeon]